MKKLAMRVTYPRITGRILDIGSGNNSLEIATHIVDLMPDRNDERMGDLEQASGKIFKQGDLEAIPYPDKHFDLVHAAHVLEHVQDPAKALAELQRVALAGYIETPAPVTEQGTFFEEGYPGWRFHRWYVWTFPGAKRIYIKPKTDSNLCAYCGCEYGRGFAAMLSTNKFNAVDPLVPYYCKMTQFAWNGTFDYEIWNEDQQGRIDPDTGRCNCFYSAFFAHFRVYLKSWTQIRRRWQMKRELPVVFSLATRLASLR